MKLPSPLPPLRRTGNEAANVIISNWRNIATSLSMEHGIFIDVQFELGDDLVPVRIWFDVMGHQFDSLIDLRKALELKAFL